MSKSTAKKGNLLVATLQFKTASTYQENLETLLSYIEQSSANLIVASELCLTNFDYEHFAQAADFYEVALEQLLEVDPRKILVLTMTKKEGDNFVNQALVIYNHQVLHEQNKYKLFKLGHEEKYFMAGKEKDIVTFEIEGISYALLICFELRFKSLWKQIEGAEVVLIPSRWGKTRKRHLEVLSQALAIMNQTFVIVSNSADDDMASSSAIISPWGEVTMDDAVEAIEKSIDLKEVKKVRRMISMS
ncbi:carbon-nitrogen hydrolase family protein [bacterium]|nr:carbon-nitrogen hydrolase family protein [bacterium]MBU1957071.1 carbon-nitrogen hydrolase family protein [bacterium]